ncbi:hypothetical protein FN846DRAFT_894607 [Sphaerosporella brunnea]|uniref:Uncharacterized protein n=1 Tax=Sphaerosporella brunnea TaxID=1250544 RepID=A0A5J5EII6_9PEZI|nr:hypothetical protein FN846DRAFT_894607 [Sphaerosporella brunnea]
MKTPSASPCDVFNVFNDAVHQMPSASAIDVSNAAWRETVVEHGLKKGLLNFALSGEGCVYHLDRELVDTWEVCTSPASLTISQLTTTGRGGQNLVRTVADKMQIELDVVYDMLGDPIDPQNWHRVCSTSPYAFACFKVTGTPVLSKTLYTAGFECLKGLIIKFRLPPTEHLTVAQLREVIEGFFLAFNHSLNGTKIAANDQLRIDLNEVDVETCGELLEDTIWLTTKCRTTLMKIVELKAIECGNQHSSGGNGDDTLIAITQGWRPCSRNIWNCRTIIKQKLFHADASVQLICDDIVNDFDKMNETDKITFMSLDALTCVRGEWDEVSNRMRRLKDFEGPVKAVLTYCKES